MNSYKLIYTLYLNFLEIKLYAKEETSEYDYVNQATIDNINILWNNKTNTDISELMNEMFTLNGVEKFQIYEKDSGNLLCESQIM